MQRSLSLALGGKTGSRLAKSLGLPISGDSLLRRLVSISQLPAAKLRVIGVDDWALRRGQTYGTLICDLERNRHVAMLSTRFAEALIEWLKAHPEIEIISRDREGGVCSGRSGRSSSSGTSSRSMASVLQLNGGTKKSYRIKTNGSKHGSCFRFLRKLSNCERLTPVPWIKRIKQMSLTVLSISKCYLQGRYPLPRPSTIRPFRSYPQRGTAKGRLQE